MRVKDIEQSDEGELVTSDERERSRESGERAQSTEKSFYLLIVTCN